MTARRTPPPEPLLASRSGPQRGHGWIERIATFMVGLCIGLMLLGIIYMGRARSRQPVNPPAPGASQPAQPAP